MTQEDHQLDVSHQQSNSVYDDDQVNDDSHTKNISKNIITTKTNSVFVAVGDIDIQKSLNNDDGNDDENGTISYNTRNIKNNMGAAYIIGSKENELTTETNLPLASTSISSSSLPLPSSSSSQTTLLSTVNQLLSSSEPLTIIQSDQNENQLPLDNLTNNENIAIASTTVSNDSDVIKNDVNEQKFKKDSVVEQTNIVGISCETDTVTENNSKMTVIKPQANNENIREILQMKIEDENKNNNDTSNVNNNGNNNSQKIENKVDDIGEKKLNQVQSEKNENSKIENDNQNNPLESENDLKNEIEKNKSDNENLINDGGAEIKRKSKERLISRDRDDPIARLNALKANISNALKEVKAVLIEHGEPVTPEKPEKSKESKEEQDNNSESSRDDGIVKFRFVKKIRRRSTFEDDQNAITEIVINQVVKNVSDNESETKSSETEGQIANSLEEQNKNDGSETSVRNDSIMPLVESAISEVKNVEDTQTGSSEGKTEETVDENEQVKKVAKKSNDKKIVKVKKLVKRNSKDDTSSVTNNKELQTRVEENESKKSVLELSKDDKKPVRVKKLVKRNSKDDSGSTVTNGENANDSKKGENPSSTEDVDAKKKIVKKVVGTKKTIKSTVATALDKVLATTNLKLPGERRASIATTKIPEEPSKATLEKRRSSTTQTALKSSQPTQNLKTNSVPPIRKTNESVAKTNDVKSSTVLSSENNKTENNSEKINTNQGSISMITNPNKESNLSSQKSSSQNSTRNTAISEKENIAPVSTQESKKQITETIKTDTSQLVPKTLESKETSKTSNGDSSSTAMSNQKSIVQLQGKDSSQSTELNKETSKQSQTVENKSEKLSDDSENVKRQNVDTKVVVKENAQVSDSKQAVDVSPQIENKKSSENSTKSGQKEIDNTTKTTPTSQGSETKDENKEAGTSLLATATSQNEISLPIPASLPEAIDRKEEQSVSQQENQTNSNSPVVRNEITAKLAGLKRPPFKMPIVNKPNIEAAKIHPLMVLHITPPKNSSVTTFRKVPQKATIESTEDHDDAEGETDDKVSKMPEKRKTKKVVIRRVKRRLSVDVEDKPLELEVEEKEIEPKTPEKDDQDNEEDISKTKSCLKLRVYEPGEIVMYAERIKSTFKWKKATVLEKITSISYKVSVDGQEKPAHISCIKKYTDKKVHFGGKEYLEIDYARDEDDDDEEEEKYNIWARV